MRLVILALLLALGWQVWRMQDQLTAAKAQEQQLRQQVQTQQQENDALQKSIDQGGSQEEMERIARDELGLVIAPPACGNLRDNGRRIWSLRSAKFWKGKSPAF